MIHAYRITSGSKEAQDLYILSTRNRGKEHGKVLRARLLSLLNWLNGSSMIT